MGTRSHVVLAAVLAGAAALTGCTDPYGQGFATKTTKTQAQSPVGRTQTTGTYPTAPPPSATTSPATGGLGPTPKAALTHFGRLYTNWTAKTVAGQYQSLSRRSVGQAARSLAQTARQARDNSELLRDGVTNRGTIESIAPRRGHPNAYIIVTRETTGAASGAYDGLTPAYHVTLAQVQQVAGGWTVSAWQLQS
jgi:hypothetical protein